MPFEVVGEIVAIARIAKGLRVRERGRLQRRYGVRRWQKMKGLGAVRLESGQVRRAELHWYEVPLPTKATCAWSTIRARTICTSLDASLPSTCLGVLNGRCPARLAESVPSDGLRRLEPPVHLPEPHPEHRAAR
jgi:hypothetical protein